MVRAIQQSQPELYKININEYRNSSIKQSKDYYIIKHSDYTATLIGVNNIFTRSMLNILTWLGTAQKLTLTQSEDVISGINHLNKKIYTHNNHHNNNHYNDIDNLDTLPEVTTKKQQLEDERQVEDAYNPGSASDKATLQKMNAQQKKLEQEESRLPEEVRLVNDEFNQVNLLAPGYDDNMRREVRQDKLNEIMTEQLTAEKAQKEQETLRNTEAQHRQVMNQLREKQPVIDPNARQMSNKHRFDDNQQADQPAQRAPTPPPQPKREYTPVNQAEQLPL